MDQQQYNNYYQPLPSHTMANQQWNASTGGPVYQTNNNITFCPWAHTPAAPFQMQQHGPVRPQEAMPQAYGPISDFNRPPGMRPGEQMPASQRPHAAEHVAPSDSSTVKNIDHVCSQNKAGKSEQWRQARISLCRELRDRKQEYSCNNVGADVTDKCVAEYLKGDPKKASDLYWRRAQKNVSQTAGRQKKAQAKQSVPNQRRAAVLTPPILQEDMGNYQAQQILLTDAVIPQQQPADISWSADTFWPLLEMSDE